MVPSWILWSPYMLRYSPLVMDLPLVVSGDSLVSHSPELTQGVAAWVPFPMLTSTFSSPPRSISGPQYNFLKMHAPRKRTLYPVTQSMKIVTRQLEEITALVGRKSWIKELEGMKTTLLNSPDPGKIKGQRAALILSNAGQYCLMLLVLSLSHSSFLVRGTSEKKGRG